DEANDELLRAKRTASHVVEARSPKSDSSEPPNGLENGDHERFLAAAGETAAETRRLSNEAALAAGRSGQSADRAEQAARQSSGSADRAEQAAGHSLSSAELSKTSAAKTDKALTEIVDAASGLQGRI